MTYSIAARCPETGQIGVAVQSHYLATGSKAPWIRNDAGGVLTQSVANLSFGPKGLEMMKLGQQPDEVVAMLAATDERVAVRQFGMVNLDGAAAAFTGEQCTGHASHVVGNGFVCMANLMAVEGVPEAMAAAWVADAGGPLVERLLNALDAAQAQGGDLRGMQAAAIHVAVPDVEWWDASIYNLRVDDHAEPLVELRRLVNFQRAYDYMDMGMRSSIDGDIEGARQAYERAKLTQPDSVEICFWFGVMLANEQRIAEAREQLALAFAEGDHWRELLKRLPSAGRLRVDPQALL